MSSDFEKKNGIKMRSHNFRCLDEDRKKICGVVERGDVEQMQSVLIRSREWS
jgi:hypothetical protein